MTKLCSCKSIICLRIQQHLGKNIAKGITQVSGHFLKLHFYMFKRSQGKYNNLDCHNVFWNIFHWLQSLLVLNLTQFLKKLHVESTQTLRTWTILVFFKHFFSTKCAPFLFKIEKDFNIDDQKGKRTSTNENEFYNPFEYIWLKSVFDLENYGFWKCGFKKNHSYLCDKRYECMI